MRILQNHVDYIEYEPIQKEIPTAEETEKEKTRIEDALVLFVSVENGDTEKLADKAMEDAHAFMQKLKVKKVLIYPFAHLSKDLAPADDALKILKAMQTYSENVGIETYRAPFGWNKGMELKVKAHPLAEQSRVYTAGKTEDVVKKIRKENVGLSEHEMMARIKKSDFAGLPETDHRTLGEKLDLFSFQEPSPGMVYWHDKGVKLRHILMEFIRAELAKRGYIEIETPALANTILWKVSGHWDYYKDNMFATKLGEEEFGLKPMNCPSTFLFYKSRKWSYKDLPLRVSDFDQLYRNELSGVASGLFRVKVLTQDDAHIFVTEKQIEKEIEEQIDLMEKFYKIFGLKYTAKISTMPDNHIGTKEQWDEAVKFLTKAAKAKGIKAVVKEKEGAFYGPKIDVDVKDSMGREWQCATIQLDFQMPQRFKLTYTGEDGKEHTPIVIHRVIYGSLERFIGILIEHYQGKFPVWLAPVQTIVLPISDENLKYAEKVFTSLRESSVRVDIDRETRTLDYKIREAQLQKIPYIIVVGEKEEKAKTIAVRDRDSGKTKYGVKLDKFVEEIKNSSKMAQ